MMLDIIQYGFGLMVMLVMFVAVWESSKIIDEKKDRQRRGVTDYYGNLIKGDKDEQ